MLDSGSTEDRLMIIIAQGEAIGESLQHRGLFLLGVVEAHFIA
jgi:hypothetical protein